ncbi:Ig-like domain-containing protein [Marinobacterium maritimum]
MYTGHAYASLTSANAAAPDLPAIARGVPMGGTLELFNVDLEQVGVSELELERFAVFSSDTQLVVDNNNWATPPSDAYFRGRIAGHENSIVVLAVPEQGPMRGIITDASGVWLLAGQSSHAPRGLTNRKVNLELELADKPFACGNETGTFNASSLMPDGGSSTYTTAASLPANVSHTARVAVETDYEFFALFNNVDEAYQYIGDLFAYASTVYEREVDTNLTVSWSRLWTNGAASDPWTARSGTDTALYEFQDHWNASSDVPGERTIAHMLSGKSLGGGIAYVGVLCNDSYGYGVSASLGGNFNINDPAVVWDLLVVTHEIGHNFDSSHTQDYCGTGGSPDPVDRCYTSSNCGSSLGLPGWGTLSGGTTADKPGTIMSYCHLLSGGYSNISLTFGQDHGYGVDAFRVPNVMKAHVANRAAAFPNCLALQASGTPPVANDDYATTLEDSPVTFDVLSNDMDADGDALTVSTITQGGNGSVANNGDGTLTYTPDANYNGTDSFNYSISDGNGGNDSATVNLTISAVNDAPSAVAQSVTVIRNEPVAITLTGSDPENTPLTYLVVFPPANGSLSGTAPNLLYTPNTDYLGYDSFSFTVNDGALTSASAEVSITVEDAPAVLSVTGITPSTVPIGTVDAALTISGTGFDSSTAIAFSGGAGPAPTITIVAISADGTTIDGYLTARDGGPNRDRSWDLTLTNADGSSDTLTNALLVSMSAPASNTPPTAEFSYTVTDLTVSFTDTSSDSDGTVASWVWDFGDDMNSTEQNVQHTYDIPGTYTVTLTVTDDEGASDTTSQNLTVGDTTGGISLTLVTRKNKGARSVDLVWSGATSETVMIYRDGTLLETTANDGAESYDQSTGKATTYQVCDTTGCSNEAIAVW